MGLAIVHNDSPQTMLAVEREYFCDENLDYYPSDWVPVDLNCGPKSAVVWNSETSHFLTDALGGEVSIISLDHRPYSPIQSSVSERITKRLFPTSQRIGKIKKRLFPYSSRSGETNERETIEAFTAGRKFNASTSAEVSQLRIGWRNGMPLTSVVLQSEYCSLHRPHYHDTCGYASESDESSYHKELDNGEESSDDLCNLFRDVETSMTISSCENVAVDKHFKTSSQCRRGKARSKIVTKTAKSKQAKYVRKCSRTTKFAKSISFVTVTISGDEIGTFRRSEVPIVKTFSSTTEKRSLKKFAKGRALVKKVAFK